MNIGCMPILVAYPEGNYFRPIPVEGNDDMFAVAVHSTQILNGNLLRSYCARQEFTILSPDKNAHIRTPPKITFDRGVGFVTMVPNPWIWGQLHDSEIRLYRRGFKLVTVESWPVSKEILWERATTRQEQKQAIDELIRVSGSSLLRDTDAELKAQGDESKFGSDYPTILQFASREYKWCADQLATNR